MESMKKDLIRKIAHYTVNEDNIRNDNIILMTASGIVKGIPVKYMDEMDDSNEKFFAKIVQDTTDMYNEKRNSEENPISENDGYIMLRDVIMDNGAGTYNIPIAVIFYDQILGISLG